VVVSCANYDWATGVWPDNAVVIAKPDFPAMLLPRPREGVNVG
jgi:hypothetical protein